jgi:DNA mismatch repair protein MutL
MIKYYVNIRKLTENEILQIAAGEIIQGQFSVIKELIENSIDAKSTEIEVIVNSKSIIVKDNGIGISKENLAIATLQHTTSKFISLNEINTLGFRGEGLYTIFQVSQSIISSRISNSFIGYELRQNNIIETPMNQGTIVEVYDLFYNLPVRKKYLNNEREKIIKLLEKYIVCYENIKFSLKFNKKIIHFFQLEGEKIPFDLNIENHQFRGYIIKNNIHNKQFIFVNNRPIENRRIYSEISKLYFNRIGKNKLFSFVLHINCSSSIVDVNIHPTKREVRFLNEKIIDKFIQKLTETLFCRKKYIKNEKSFSFKEENLVYVCNFKNRYFLLKDSDELIIVDQHAAHERIVSEELKANNCLSQQLLIDPIIIHSRNLNYNKIKSLFQFNILNERLIIYSIPSILSIESSIYFLQTWNEENIFFFLSDYIHQFGCKNSIKSGDYLNEKESIELYKKLLRTENGHICNHGRPTFFSIEQSFLDKLFMRRQ